VTVAVEPLRHALLEHAHAEAERVLAAADERADELLAEAEAHGAALVEQARADGLAAAALAGAHEQALARRRARGVVLTAQRDLYLELRRQARDAVHALRQEPRSYAALLERLSTAALGQLGNGASLEVDPTGAGGVRASSGPRHVDYTLDALVERCLERLGGDLERLWHA
jgi:vacuolar-type H+-ATPase subunit E/Vma4